GEKRKGGAEKGGEHHSGVFLAVLGSADRNRWKESLNPREELTTMWSRLYRKHVIMAFPTYNTVANAWAPQADINWFAGSSHDSKFVRFSKRCTTEEEAVTWVLRRSEVWVDNRLRRLKRATLLERGQAIDMIEAAKSHLGKVTPKQPLRVRSSGRRMLQRRIGTQP